MKNEAELNRVIVRSLNEEGFAFKIPDTVSYVSKKHPDLPFDIFGICNNKPIYIESKFLNEPKAFNFNRLEQHQIDNLCKCKDLCPSSICLFLVGVVFGRGDIRVYYFDDPYYIRDRKACKLSISKKEFQSMNNFIRIKKGKIDFSQMKSV